jgi:hypothetical protein
MLTSEMPGKRGGRSGVSTCGPWDRGWLAGHPTTPTLTPQTSNASSQTAPNQAAFWAAAVCPCRAPQVLDVNHTWPSARDLALSQSQDCCAGLAADLAGPLSVRVIDIHRRQVLVVAPVNSSGGGECCVGRSVRMRGRDESDDRLIRWPSRARRMLRGSDGGRGCQWRVRSDHGGDSARTHARQR